MAQLGARLDGIEEVVGSNPISSTITLCWPGRGPAPVPPGLNLPIREFMIRADSPAGLSSRQELFARIHRL